MKRVFRSTSILLGVLFLIAGCTTDKEGENTEVKSEPKGSLLTYLPAERTGIAFNNAIEETVELNYFTYQYFYNGGGVAAGDVNNDGLVDLYFTGNMVADKLYINKGNFEFEDVTAKALPGLPNTWHQGVTMADVNDDGWLDIYVCRGGYFKDYSKTSNLFWQNNGDGTFTEMASELGIADTTRSTQASFFDLEGDGDLDLFVMNTPLHNKGMSNVARQERINRGISSSDRLFVNDGGSFTDMSTELGIQNHSYGLGLALADINQDGAMDIYEANDYDLPDFMYMNRGERFSEELQQRTRHISNFGMGCDIADYNNDGLPDIMVLDMVSEDHVRSKMNMAGMSTERFWKLVRVGYHKQYMVNTLQLNNGNGTFSEIGQLAGVARTDWSWSALFADMDNDGWKDLLVTNGYKRDMRNNDFADKFEGYLNNTDKAKFNDILDLIPSTRIKNYAFKNNGDLTFDNKSEEWGLTLPVNSNGMAYADLDNDGDLDLVVNNMDMEASIIENLSTNHFLRIKPKVGKRDAIGTKVHLWSNGLMQYQELSPTRGYQSSMEPVLHFGLGASEKVDSMNVIWPNGMVQTFKALPADTTLTLQQGGSIFDYYPEQPFDYFQRDTLERIRFSHNEDPYNDFQKEVLLPHKYSTQGPHVAVADVNADGLDDLFICGAHMQASELFLQKADGRFRRSFDQPWEFHAVLEQIGAAFFDGDNDGDLDLLVTSGSNQHDIRSDMYQHHYYRNEGKGKFVSDEYALPNMQTSGSRVAVGDVNGDKIPDLFICGRVSPGLYPFPPRSYLLANDGKGKFIDVTAARAKDLMGPGMVTDARFADIDSDGDQDLVVCGEWMNLSVYENKGQGFVDATKQWGLDQTHGWWKSLELLDIDNDGDLDIAAGNFGLNNKFSCDKDHPFHVYWADFDDNGKKDIVLAKEKGSKQLPLRGRECSSEQCPVIEERFPTFEEFAHADLGDIYGAEKLADALHLIVSEMSSCVFINEGGSFKMKKLPLAAQIAPINDMIAMDVNQDGFMDLLAAGNEFDAEVETVAHDAGTGLVLINDNGSGNFDVIGSCQSGFFAWNQVRSLDKIEIQGKTYVIVSNNNGPLELLEYRRN